MKFFTLCLIMLVMIGGAVCSYGLDVREIQKSIQAAGSAWTAEENRFTRLSPEEKIRLLGALPESIKPTCAPDDSSAALPPTSSFLFAFPSAWDWRNKDGQNWISPVRDQRPYGTCAAFSAIACLESLMKIQANDPDLNVDLSERFLFAYGGGDSVLGWWASQAADFLMTVGTVSESAFPYSEWDGSVPADSATPHLMQNPTYLVESWENAFFQYIPIPQYENQVKTALLEVPFVAMMEVYEDFFSYSGGIYEKVSGNYMGNHLVLLIGWDDAQDCWICKNSWGTDWGESGFFRVRKSNMGKTNFPSYSIRLYPRISSGMRYYTSDHVPAAIPDPGTLSTTCEVRGLANATDITFQIFLNHSRVGDVICNLFSPLGGNSILINKRSAAHPNFEDLFLNDKCLSSLSDFIAAHEQYGFDFYRGCVKPDNSLSSLLYTSPYGFWDLNASDDTSGEAGNLAGWGLFFAAQRVTNADPAVWNLY